ncbi:MAG: hypothetical protein ACJAWM_001560 [Sulfitobacter sp.]|jgi:hypothetical protein
MDQVNLSKVGLRWINRDTGTMLYGFTQMRITFDT